MDVNSVKHPQSHYKQMRVSEGERRRASYYEKRQNWYFYTFAVMKKEKEGEKEGKMRKSSHCGHESV